MHVYCLDVQVWHRLIEVSLFHIFYHSSMFYNMYLVVLYSYINYKDFIYKTKDRIGKDKYYFLDCNKTSKQLNWKPKINIYEGIKRIINYKNK